MRPFRKTHYGMLLLTCAVLCLVGSYQARAATDDYFDLAPEQLLRAKVVSASRKSESVATAPAAAYVVTHEDIVRSGVTNIPDALRMVPGVEVAQINSSQWAISVRGFNSQLANKLLVMIDGRTVYNPLFAGTYWELQDLVLRDVERIEVVRGPGGALWGANAVNGVINIITKAAKDTQGTFVEAGGGTYENGFVSGRYGHSFGTNGFYRVYAKNANRGSFEKDNGDNAHDAWQNSRAGFRADMGDDFTLQGDAYHVRTHELNNTYSLTAPFITSALEELDSQGANILGRLKHGFDDGGHLSVQSYLDYTRRDQELLEDNRLIFDTEAQYNFAPIGIHEIITGGGFRLTSDDLGESDAVTASPDARTDKLYNLFAQDKITLVPDHWFLTLGSKVEYNDYTGFEIEPNTRLSWTPNELQTVWASVSRAVRMPSRLERDLNISTVLPPGGVLGGLPAQLVETANKDFESEKLVAYELGYRQQVTPDVSFDVATFANNYTDISTVGFLQPSLINGGTALLFPYNSVNGATAETYGLELASSWSVTPTWKLSVDYTYLNIFLHVKNGNGFSLEGAEEQSPHHQGGIRSSWNINKDWTLDTSAEYVGRLRNFDVPSYVRFDANLGWSVSSNLHFNLIGQNLLDSSHREFGSAGSLNTQEIPRSVFGKLTWEF